MALKVLVADKLGRLALDIFARRGIDAHLKTDLSVRHPPQLRFRQSRLPPERRFRRRRTLPQTETGTRAGLRIV